MSDGHTVHAPTPLHMAQHRNTVLNELFYDIGALTMAEREALIGEENVEGSILVVWPRGEKGEMGVVKFDGYEELRAAPGRLLDRFTIAGVGSSDVGAAALARGVADHCGAPVGAVIAGYGVSDLLAEAMGGWLALGTANRVMAGFQAFAGMFAPPFVPTPPVMPMDATAARASRPGRGDTAALLRLLRDEEREIRLLLGHSKGCLSIAAAMELLALAGPSGDLDNARDIPIVTTGAVVALPTGFRPAAQFLGMLDWFGGMNSRAGLRFDPVAGAWHHLNTALPFHMDLAAVLRRADAAFAKA